MFSPERALTPCSKALIGGAASPSFTRASTTRAVCKSRLLSRAIALTDQYLTALERVAIADMGQYRDRGLFQYTELQAESGRSLMPRCDKTLRHPKLSQMSGK